MFITSKPSLFQDDEESQPINDLVSSLMSLENPLDEKMTSSKVSMYSEGIKQNREDGRYVVCNEGKYQIKNIYILMERKLILYYILICIFKWGYDLSFLIHVFYTVEVVQICFVFLNWCSFFGLRRTL